MLRTALKWSACAVVGLALGVGAAVQQIRTSALGDEIRIGPWSTGRDIGTVDASLATRATVALRGLLALPKEEARYFTARTDSAGNALLGRCTYVITGAMPAARWWSITIYDREGWLIANSRNRHSIGSVATTTNSSATDIVIGLGSEGPDGIDPETSGPFELTLRLYRPSGVVADNPADAVLPEIESRGCAR
jgi:hypothetical protein